MSQVNQLGPRFGDELRQSPLSTSKRVNEETIEQHKMSYSIREKDYYTVRYNSRSTLSVLLQLKGSIWKEVIPYCLLNLTVLLISWYFQREHHRINVTQNGHQLSGVIVSFFVVIRSNTALGKYHKGRKDLGQVWRMLPGGTIQL